MANSYSQHMEWKQIPGHPKYLISDAGLVSGPRGHVLSGYTDKNGYKCISPNPRAKVKAFKVHRKVVEAFCGPIPEGMQVNHKNGIKDDNRLENLEVVTPGENILHSFRVLGRKPPVFPRKKGEDHYKARLTENDVREIRRLALERRMTQARIAEIYSIPQSNVSAIHLRKSWPHVSD